jgi:prophage maintenance system killer protein
VNIQLIELTADQVAGLNRSAIKFANNQPGQKQVHALRDRGGLESCVGSIFYQSSGGYLSLPIEKMAGLLLYRIAEGQYFVDGNKRTSVLACVAFLSTNGLKLHVVDDELDDLIWNFAPPPNDPMKAPKYSEDDAIQYIFDNVLPK